MLSALLSFAGWSYLPDLITRKLLPFFHRFYRDVLHRPVPAPNTPLYLRHYRYVYAFTVISYLLYNFYDAAASMAPNYYELLGVDPTADENTLKLAFRQFARKNHPDRVGQQGEALFIEVRDAFNALKNPVTRFAYDRFGPEALNWAQCTTLREYVRHGLMQSIGFHVVAACFLLLVSAVGRPSYVAFWRYLLFAAVFAYELGLIMSPSPSAPSSSSVSSAIFSDPGSPSHASVFSILWPKRVAYQHIRFLHSFFMFLSVALSRVAPVLFSPTDVDADPTRLLGELDKVGVLSKLMDREVSSQIHTELHSVHGPRSGTKPTTATFMFVPPCEDPADEIMDRLSEELECMIIESQLMDGGPLKSAVDTAVERRRQASMEQQHKRPVRMGMPSPTPSPPPSEPVRPLPERSPSRKTQFALNPGARKDERSVGYVRGRSQSY